MGPNELLVNLLNVIHKSTHFTYLDFKKIPKKGVLVPIYFLQSIQEIVTFYIVNYDIKCGTNSWTYSMQNKIIMGKGESEWLLGKKLSMCRGKK